LIPLVSFLSGAALGQTFQFFPYLSALLCLAAFVFLVRKRRYALVLIVALGVAYPLVRFSPPEEAPEKTGVVTVEGVFVSPAASRRSGFWQTFRTGGNAFSVLSDREFQIGRRYVLKLRPMVPGKRLNPGARRWKPYGVLIRAVSGGDTENSPALFFNRLRDRLNRAIRGRFPPDSAALLMAVTTGHRAEMGHEMRDAFSRTGLAHLLSISGTHFGLFSLLLFGMFRAAVKRLPMRALERLTVYLTPSQAAALLTLPFMFFYLGISGARIPAVRSFLMISLFLLGIFLGRKGAWLNFLLLAAVLLVLWDPTVLGSLSFQLSFTAVLFIGWGLTMRKGRAPGGVELPERAGYGYVKRTFLITLFATLGVAPIVAYYFHYVSLISPLSNFVVTPLVCFLTVPLSLAGAFFYLLTGEYVTGFPLQVLSESSIFLVRAFTSVPLSSLRMPQFPPALLLFYYLGFLLFWITRKRAALSVAFAPVALYAAVALLDARPLSVTFLDAGGSHASVVELPDGKVVAVDAGRSGKELGDYLRLRGHEAVDALVLTNGSLARAGGAGKILEQFRVGEIWDNGRLVYPAGMLDGVKQRRLERGDTIEGKGYGISVLHPYEGFYTVRDDAAAEKNNDSLVVRLDGESASFLLTSDIEEEAAKNIAALGDILKSDVIKLSGGRRGVAAHGGFLKAVSPGVAVVSGAELQGNAARRLSGTDVLFTGLSGAVKIEDEGDGLRIKTHGDYAVVRTRELKEELRNIRRLFSVW
jgi:competence protein ComEC